MVATTTSDTSLQRRAAAKSCHAPPPPPEAPPLPCPRCDSTNTKFCYYNNYNFSQPRHFCKSCRRYWTQGGTLRDIPIGGGSRKNTAKRFRTTAAAASSAHNTFQHSPAAGGSLVPFSGEVQYHHVFGGAGGSFTSLLSGSGGINGLLGMGGFGLDDVGFGLQSNLLSFGGTDTWQVGDGSFPLPELAISSTPTTDFMK